MQNKIKSVGLCGALLFTGVTYAATGQVSFTPVSFKMPITGIVLQGPNGSPSAQVFGCTPSADDSCEVDVMDSASIATFQAKLGAATVPTGTYTQVWFNCSTGSSALGSTGYLKFKGTATTASGTTYYTASGTAPVVTDKTKYDYVTAGNMLGCGSTNNLPVPLTINEGDGLTISLFVNMSNAAWFDPITSAGMGGCSVTTGVNSGLGVCTNYPTVFPYIGTTSPTIETYFIATTTGDASKLTVANANAFIKVAVDANGIPFFAPTGPYASEASVTYTGDPTVGGPNFSGSVTGFSVNADGTLAFTVGETGNAKSAVFTAFKRSSHTGTLTIGATKLNYSVFKQ